MMRKGSINRNYWPPPARRRMFFGWEQSGPWVKIGAVRLKNFF
ncbi:MAG: hypothetical protein CM15mP47_1460 [Methanobacteriota archaeon]|nr:MAG: hypothetical protein CM15mP47_1460 [Euryarchaeota archaeon]